MSKTIEQSRSFLTANLIKFLDATEIVVSEKVSDSLNKTWAAQLTCLDQLPNHSAMVAARLKLLCADFTKKATTVKPAPSSASATAVSTPEVSTTTTEPVSQAMEVEPAKPLESPVSQTPPARAQPSATSDASSTNSSFSLGDRVLAKWKGKAKAYPGTISAVNDDGTYNIDYNDGDKETHVTANLIKVVKPAPTPSKILIPPPRAPPPTPPKMPTKMTLPIPPPRSPLLPLPSAPKTFPVYKPGTRVNAQMPSGKKCVGIVKQQRRDGSCIVMLENRQTMKFASRALQVRIRPKAPPSIHHAGWKCALKVGMPVLAKWKGGSNVWGAKVVAVNPDGTFSLHYDDGDKDQRVARSSICAKVPEKTGPPFLTNAIVASL